jgi:hypothetical protein
MAERSFAELSHRATGVVPQARETALAQLRALWTTALDPHQDRLSFHAVIEEAPMLGYDAFYKLVTGATPPAVILSRFPTFTPEDLANVEHGVELMQATFDRPAAEAAVAAAVSAGGAGG